MLHVLPTMQVYHSYSAMHQYAAHFLREFHVYLFVCLFVYLFTSRTRGTKVVTREFHANAIIRQVRAIRYYRRPYPVYADAKEKLGPS